MDKRQQRLIKLLEEMQGDLSQRSFARKIRINPGSLQQYMIGDHFPQLENLEKIAIARGWTREELDAYLENRPVRRNRSIDQVLQEVRAMTPQEALEVVRVAIEVVESGL